MLDAIDYSFSHEKSIGGGILQEWKGDRGCMRMVDKYNSLCAP